MMFKMSLLLFTSMDASRKLTTYNPLKIKIGIEEICGVVEAAEYQRSGGIIITVKTKNQIQLLINAKKFPKLNIPITGKIAWTNQFSYGKLWAPELIRDSLDEILDMFKEQNVMAVKKLLNDPNKQNVPLYVFTFLGPAPKKIKLGYLLLPLDKFLPNPMQCRSCWRFGHTKKLYRSKPTCPIG